MSDLLYALEFTADLVLALFPTIAALAVCAVTIPWARSKGWL
jgi:hypothetical protein